MKTTFTGFSLSAGKLPHPALVGVFQSTRDQNLPIGTTNYAGNYIEYRFQYTVACGLTVFRSTAALRMQVATFRKGCSTGVLDSVSINDVSYIERDQLIIQ